MKAMIGVSVFCMFVLMMGCISTVVADTSQGYTVVVEAIARHGDAIMIENDFSRSYRTPYPLLICELDRIVVHHVYEENGPFVAERLQITLHRDFDSSGIRIKRVRVWNQSESSENPVCERVNTK